jgi:membrane-associated phospholipid phosphatase
MTHSRRLLGGLAVCFLVMFAAGTRDAEAQEGIRDLDASYLVDGGAVPFFWVPLAGSLAMTRWVDPRHEPLVFSKSEGGAPSERGNEVPGWAISAGAGLAAATILIDGDESRWYHIKGFGQAIVTTSFLTGATKRIFGRHRPDHDGSGVDSGDGNKSFPSGHASQTAAAITYFAMYLHQHGFDRFRDRGELPWWEVASYATLGALAVAVPAERVLHKRHHLGDVVAGSVLGAAVSTGLFLWQEHRYESRGERDDATMSGDVARMEVPAPTMGDTAAPTFSISGTF